MLTTLFFFLRFFFFALESDEDFYDDESDDEGYGYGFTFSLCLASFFEISVDHVSGLSFNVVTNSVCSVCGIFSAFYSKSSLVSIYEFLL